MSHVMDLFSKVGKLLPHHLLASTYWVDSIDRIREKERLNPKFSFLSQGDAYNPFYLWRLTEVREGRGTAVSAGRVGEAAHVEPEKPKGPEKPPDFYFSAR